MEESFLKHIKHRFPGMLNQRFLLACSGGLDSVVLCHLCVSLDLDFEIAHCDFKLRGRDSDSDREFVENLAKKVDHIIHVKCFNTSNNVSISKQSIQQEARMLRYDWFKELTAQHNLAFTATAHHADDELETFLINLTRGGGLQGLTGIPDRTPDLCRPLLSFTRSEIRSYAEKNEIQWREDISNLEDKYLRNRLRKEVIPPLKAADTRFFKNFLKTQGYLRGSKALVTNHIRQVKEELFVEEGNVIIIHLAALNRLDPLEAYCHELFREFGFTDWKALSRLLKGESGREIHSRTYRLIRDRDALLLKARTDLGSISYDFALKEGIPKIPVTLKIEQVASVGDIFENVLYADKNTLNKRLKLRKWQKGDYFYPFGMQGRQKVSKYFKDHKFSTLQKEAQWLLCSEDDIIWIVGQRSDDRFKVKDTTTEIVKITWIDSENF